MHVEGPLLMLAGPGSGKTRVVTHRIGYMLQQGISPSAILALTFTNKAADEMRSRLHRLVGDCPVWMGTFHSFCVRLLRRYARLVGLPENFSIYDTDDSLAALKVAASESQFSLTHVSLGSLANRISFFKNRLVTAESLQAEAITSDEHQIAQVYPFYQRQLLKCGAVDFDDLLMHTALLLRSSPTLRAELDQRYRYVMVDEYQDTNLAQYVIVRHLSLEFPNLAATGDPDQSIYGWRGANLQNISYLERDYPGTTVIRLEQNYRSTPEILSVADGLIRNNEYRKPKQLVPSRQSGSAVRLCVYANGRREAEDIADRIAASVNTGERRLSDFAVLYRTNSQSKLLEQALLQRRMPYQLIGGYRFYMRKEVKDLIAYLLLLNNPSDDIAFARVINMPPRGIGKQTLTKLSQSAARQRLPLLESCRHMLQSGEASTRTTKGLSEFLRIYDSLTSLLHGPLSDLIEATLELTGYREYLKRQGSAENDHDETLANIHELVAEAAELDSKDHEASPLEAFLEYAALQGDVDKLQLGSEQVTLMTLHAAKGLEFPVVFIIALEENILPHQRSRDDPLGIEEERRLLFVGMTRARDHLQLSYAKRRGFRGQDSPSIPSSFLVELPRADMEWVDQSESNDEYRNEEFGEDDYNQAAPFWDDVEQVTDENKGTVKEDSGFDDEMCQLPPDEASRKIKQKAGRILTGTQLAENIQTSRFSADLYSHGRVVSHNTYGSGRIVAANGRGPKRSVTVEFFTDGLRRTFRLSHVHLSIEEES